MRSISTELLAEQNKASNTPYTYMLLTSADGGLTFDYSSDKQGRRVLLLDHYEEPYGDNATIILDNFDRSIPNMKGYWTEIGYGYHTGEIVASPDGDSNGNEYSKTPRLWVKHQQEVSAQGRIVTVLELEGMWEYLAEQPSKIGSLPYYRAEGTFENITPYDALTLVLAEAGMTLAALVEDDSIMDTYKIPLFNVNTEPYETLAGLCQRLVSITKSYLKAKPGLEFEVKYPQSSDSADINYYSASAPYFYEYQERFNVLKPNHVYVFADEGDWGILGEASASSEIAGYCDVPLLVVAGGITKAVDATNLAEALLARAKMEQDAGRMIAPHDCQLELYDKIAAHDTRGTT